MASESRRAVFVAEDSAVKPLWKLLILGLRMDRTGWSRNFSRIFLIITVIVMRLYSCPGHEVSLSF